MWAYLAEQYAVEKRHKFAAEAVDDDAGLSLGHRVIWQQRLLLWGVLLQKLIADEGFIDTMSLIAFLVCQHWDLLGEQEDLCAWTCPQL